MRQQLRQLSGDTAIYGGTTIVQRFLTFLLTPFYTQFLLPAELGIQASIFAAIAFVMVVANAGMEAAYFKFASVAANANADERERRKIFTNALAVNWLVAFVIGGGIALLPDVFNRVAFLKLAPQNFNLIRMAGVVIFFDAAGMVSLAHLRVTRRAKAFSGVKIAAIAVNVGLNIYLVAIVRMKVEGILIANIIQSVVQFALVLPFIVRMLISSIDRALIRDMLRFGIPTLAAGLAAIALQVIDRPIMLNVMGEKGETAVGLYQANYRLGTIMMMFVSVFEFAWRPFFLQQAIAENARQLFARVFTYFNLAAAFLFLAVSFFVVNIAEARIPFRHGTIIQHNYWPGLTIVPIVLAAYIFNGWGTNFIAGVYIEKRTKALPWITGIGAGVEAILCFTLIPIIGIMGGAWATFFAYLTMASVLFFYIQRVYRIPYEWGRIAKVAGGVIVLWVINNLTLSFYDISLRSTLIRCGLLLAFPLWLIVSGFFDRSELREMRRMVSTRPRIASAEPIDDRTLP